MPVNTAYELKHPLLWQPLLETTGLGYFQVQSHVTAQAARVEAILANKAYISTATSPDPYEVGPGSGCGCSIACHPTHALACHPAHAFGHIEGCICCCCKLLATCSCLCLKSWQDKLLLLLLLVQLLLVLLLLVLLCAAAAMLCRGSTQRSTRQMLTSSWIYLPA